MEIGVKALQKAESLKAYLQKDSALPFFGIYPKYYYRDVCLFMFSVALFIIDRH